MCALAMSVVCWLACAVAAGATEPPPADVAKSDLPRATHLAVGLGSVAYRLDGLAAMLGGHVATEDVRGAQLSVGVNVAGGRAQGVQATVGANVAGGDFVGWQASSAVNVARGAVLGAQTTAGVNVAGDAVVGTQLAALVNVAAGVRGLQAAAGANVAAKRIDGVQAAAGVSVARDVRGAQLSVVNVAGDVRGAQIGIVNVADDNDGLMLGIVNVNRSGYNRLVGWASDLDLGVGVTYGGKRLYTTAQLGWDKGYDGSPLLTWLGLGWHQPVGRWFVDAEAAATGRYDRRFRETEQVIVRGRAIVGIEVVRRLAVFTGPTVNVVPWRVEGADLDLSPLRIGGTPVWVGLQAGLRI